MRVRWVGGGTWDIIKSNNGVIVVDVGVSEGERDSELERNCGGVSCAQPCFAEA